MSDLSKEYFDKKLDEQSKELKAYTRQQTEDLAQMVSAGFEDIQRQLDVREKIQDIEKTIARKFSKLEEALHIKL